MDNEKQAINRVQVIFGHLQATSNLSLMTAAATAGPTDKKRKNNWLDTLQMNPRQYWPKKYRYTVEPKPGTTPTITVKQRDFYEANGYIVVRNLIPLSRIQQYRDMMDAQQHANGSVFSSTIDSILNQYVKMDQIVRYVQCITGPNIMCMHRAATVHGSVLEPRDPSLLAPPADIHSDLWALPFRPADRIVAAWTPLDETLEPNFITINGSHRNSETTVSGLDTETVILEPLPAIETLQGERTQITLGPGDTILYHPVLAHGFPTSLATPLRALVGHFAASECCYVSMQGQENHAASHLVVQEQEQWQRKAELIKGKRSSL